MVINYLTGLSFWIAHTYGLDVAISDYAILTPRFREGQLGLY